MTGGEHHRVVVDTQVGQPFRPIPFGEPLGCGGDHHVEVGRAVGSGCFDQNGAGQCGALGLAPCDRYYSLGEQVDLHDLDLDDPALDEPVLDDPVLDDPALDVVGGTFAYSDRDDERAGLLRTTLPERGPSGCCVANCIDRRQSRRGTGPQRRTTERHRSVGVGWREAPSARWWRSIDDECPVVDGEDTVDPGHTGTYG